MLCCRTKTARVVSCGCTSCLFPRNYSSAYEDISCRWVQLRFHLITDFDERSSKSNISGVSFHWKAILQLQHSRFDISQLTRRELLYFLFLYILICCVLVFVAVTLYYFLEVCRHLTRTNWTICHVFMIDDVQLFLGWFVSNFNLYSELNPFKTYDMQIPCSFQWDAYA